MRRVLRPLLVSLAILAAFAAAGCGTGEDRDQATEVTERFYAAVERGDGEAACAQLSAATAARLESQSGQACREVVTRLDLTPGAVEDSEVYVNNAKVDLAGGDTAFLGREPTGWKLTAIGCRPVDGKPRHRPFECEVEA